ncbi:MAG TPA: hypothetical protein VFO30_06010 [Chthoniobacterales bacterium]|nr:hypothetical protein [Chthoniobacterales bacterium]
MERETESGKKEAELPSSIPEIYFDIIARVVPGAIAIAAYNFDSLSKNLNTPTISFALLCSYFLGMLLEIVGDSIWNNTFYKLQPGLRAKTLFWGRLKLFDFDSLKDIWEWLRKLPAAERPVFTKMTAERSMFQTTALLFLFWIFFPPQLVVEKVSHQFHIPARCITLLGFLACFHGMITLHTWLSWNKQVFSRNSHSAPRHGESHHAAR